jgi:hypothetical protein
VGAITGLDDMERRINLPYWDLNSDPLLIQPVASHYTNTAIPVPYYMVYDFKRKRKLASHFFSITCSTFTYVILKKQ